MDRLSFFLTLMTGAVLVGGLVIIVLALGWYNWVAIGVAAVIGFVLSWPVAYLISRMMKRADPDWDETRAKKTDAVPRPGEPEV